MIKMDCSFVKKIKIKNQLDKDKVFLGKEFFFIEICFWTI